jgi:uncharacterized protein YkwD
LQEVPHAPYRSAFRRHVSARPHRRRCRSLGRRRRLLLRTELGQTATIRTTLCLLNKERASRGLSKLRADSRLRRAADGHAGEMVAKHYFDHNSKSGATFVTRIKRTGWTRSRRSWTVGENIGYGSGSYATPRAMVRGWMNSSGHRANILRRQFRMIGIGVANGAPTGGSGATYATDFGG